MKNTFFLRTVLWGGRKNLEKNRKFSHFWKFSKVCGSHNFRAPSAILNIFGYDIGGHGLVCCEAFGNYPTSGFWENRLKPVFWNFWWGWFSIFKTFYCFKQSRVLKFLNFLFRYWIEVANGGVIWALSCACWGLDRITYKFFRNLKKFVYRITLESLCRFWQFFSMLWVLMWLCAAKLLKIIVRPVLEKTG